MPYSKALLEKIHLIEEVINFPTSLLSHRNYHWGNLSMVPFSNLKGAVSSLAERGKKALIITGFYVPMGNSPATETDGPPGALALAEGLRYLGVEASLLSDEYTVPALKAGLKGLGLSEREVPILCFPLEHSSQELSGGLEERNGHSVSIRFVQDFFNSHCGQGLTHLIYIERVGPNHTLESLTAQNRRGKPPLKEFEATLAPPIRNRCFNSRLEDISRFTARTDLLLDFSKKLSPPPESIGIGDRGNEIGAGKIPWEIFMENSSSHREAVFCSRVETDYLVSCGISNWGGYALLAGVALAKGRSQMLERVTRKRERKVLDCLIRYGPAIDGITFKREHSIDGIQFDNYMRIIERIKEIALE